MNSSVSINLRKLKNVGICAITGRTGEKDCVVIPIEDNNLFVSRDAEGRLKGVYLHLTMWDNQTPSQYGAVAYIKQSFSKEYREAHPEEMKQTPILGNVKPLASAAQNAPSVAEIANDDDLPF